MGEFKTIKVEYKITTSIKGTCPRCHEPVEMEEVEELSDDVPTRKYDEMCHELFHKDVDAYSKYLSEHPPFTTLRNLCKTWRERVEKLPIRSLIKSEAIYVLNGVCPYCDKNIELRMLFTVIYHEPPKIEPGEERKIHIFKRCPFCEKEIHITGGMFYTELECSDHTGHIPTPGGTVIVSRGRPGRLPINQHDEYPSHKELLKNTCPQCGTVFIDMSTGCPVCALEKKLTEPELQNGG